MVLFLFFIEVGRVSRHTAISKAGSFFVCVFKVRNSHSLVNNILPPSERRDLWNTLVDGSPYAFMLRAYPSIKYVGI